MNPIFKFLKSFWTEEEGLTMTEYAVAGAVIAAGAAAAFTGLGAAVLAKITEITSAITGGGG